MQEIIGYTCFILIGLTLGLIGGGGSMLAVPVLVYILHISADNATGYSLFIVGLTSLFGAFTFVKKGDFSLESIYLFAIPSLISVFCTRRLLMPLLPETFFSVGTFTASKHFVIMIVFTILILFSSFAMIRKKKNAERTDMMWGEFYRSPIHFPFIIILGILVGLISGFVGAGGGFMIIPVLVIFMRIPMKKAIGTSLVIIAINSLVGFTGSIASLEMTPESWKFLGIVSSLAITGIFTGSYFSRFIPSKKLKPVFGWFTLCVGIFIITKEIFIQQNK